MAKIEITLKRGLVGRTERQRATAASLGLFKKDQKVVHDDTPAIQGMIDKCRHLLCIKPVA